MRLFSVNIESSFDIDEHGYFLRKNKTFETFIFQSSDKIYVSFLKLFEYPISNWILVKVNVRSLVITQIVAKRLLVMKSWLAISAFTPVWDHFPVLCVEKGLAEKIIWRNTWRLIRDLHLYLSIYHCQVLCPTISSMLWMDGFLICDMIYNDLYIAKHIT